VLGKIPPCEKGDAGKFLGLQPTKFLRKNFSPGLFRTLSHHSKNSGLFQFLPPACRPFLFFEHCRRPGVTVPFEVFPNHGHSTYFIPFGGFDPGLFNMADDFFASGT